MVMQQIGIIVLLDNGTVKYAKNVYDNATNTSSFSEFKDYTLTDVTGLVNLQMKSKSGRYIQCVGATTSDGVTHILPYDMP